MAVSTPTLAQGVGDEYKYILAYGIFIAFLTLVTRSKIGYAIVYYVLVLAILFLMVTESKFIAEALKPISHSSGIHGKG